MQEDRLDLHRGIRRRPRGHRNLNHAPGAVAVDAEVHNDVDAARDGGQEEVEGLGFANLADDESNELVKLPCALCVNRSIPLPSEWRS